MGTYGVSFGAAAGAAGLDVWQAAATSLLVFTGASQFALVGILGSGGSVASGVATALLLGSRNALYSVRLAPLLRGDRRPVAAQFVLDESSAMAFARDDPAEARLAFWWTGLAVYVGWNLATVIGALGANAFADPETLGLDAAVPAAFLALLWPRLDGATERLVALGAVAITLVAVPFLPAGVPVLLAALAVLPALRWRR